VANPLVLCRFVPSTLGIPQSTPAAANSSVTSFIAQARLEERAARAKDGADKQRFLQKAYDVKHSAAERRAVQSVQAKADRAARHAESVKQRGTTAACQREQYAADKQNSLEIRMESAREARETVLYERVSVALGCDHVSLAFHAPSHSLSKLLIACSMPSKYRNA